MTEDDLSTLDAWLRLPHVARWWLSAATAEAEITKYRRRIAETRPATTMLMATEDHTSIGWCQWYRWAEYPADAAAMEAQGNEVGIDYAIGDLTCIGRGRGTGLVAALVREVRRYRPTTGLLVAPDATSVASRRVLEKNSFDLVAVRPVATEPSDNPMAIYRLPGLREPRAEPR